MSGPDPRDWFASLKHGGLLIAPSRLQEFFPATPKPLPGHVEDKLRRALTRLEIGNGDGVALLLDTVLEEVLGLGRRFHPDSGTWLKGNAVPTEWTRLAVTGEAVKPRRVWQGKNAASLPVFVDDETRIGIGRGRRAASRVVEWLRRADHRIALLTNARQWRIIYAGLDYDAFAEADTDLFFEEGAPGSQITALRTLLSPEALAPERKDALPKLLDAIETSRKGQSELARDLGERVRQAVELLIQAHAPAVAKAEELGVTPRDLYLAATRVVMRLVVVLFAEARTLLPLDSPIYHDSYGVQGLREMLDRIGGAAGAERLRHRYGAWPRLLGLFRLVYDGSPHEALPVLRYGGGLFEAGGRETTDPVRRALTFFEDPEAAPSDATVHTILNLLTKSKLRVHQGKGSTYVTTPVDFSDLSSEYIGILYEGLLNYELRRVDEDDPVVFLVLGDEPALPLSRLEAMEDKAVAALVEKAKKGAQLASGDEEEGEEDGEADEEVEAEGEGAEEEIDLEEVEPAPEEDNAASADDTRQKASERAQGWAKRAVIAGKLVSTPRAKNAAALRAHELEVEKTAKTLIRRTVLPGEWFLVRFGGTRKGTGTFYTKPQLAVPTAHRTLRPLAYDPPAGPDGKPNEDAPAAEWTPKKPEEILALKVCDPACGSGSFLVASLRFLTGALAESLRYHKRLEAHGEKTLVTLPKGLPGSALSDDPIPCRLDHPEFDARLAAKLKRYVVELCLYGVDIDPLAVELCRLALWVETMDKELPFSFLDHKIKCGNSLVGCWFDRFRDYPALAFEREGGDKNHTQGVHFQKEAWTKAIKAFRKKLKPALADWIAGQGNLYQTVEGQSPEAIHDEALAQFGKLHAFPIQEAQERADFYRQEILGSEALTRLKEAFDTWCALWLWPADRLADAPMPKELGEPSKESRQVVRELAQEHRFFHWELEFPDVFGAEGAGFDAVLGNPPWEIQKPNSKEFFSNLDPLYRSYGKQEALETQEDYFKNAEVEQSWLVYNARFKALSNWNKHVGSPFGDGKAGGDSFNFGKSSDDVHRLWTHRRRSYKGYADATHPFLWQGTADINTYKMFLETAHALLRTGGHLGLLVPSGVYTDKGSTDLRRLFLTQCRWQWLFGFENRDGIFDIHRSFKFCPVIVEKGGTTDAIKTAFMHRDLKDWEEAEKHVISYTRNLIETLSPETLAILEIISAEQLRIVQIGHRSNVSVGQLAAVWGLDYSREFHMTDDARLFPPQERWKTRGYEFVAELELWRNADGRAAVPLYEGRMIHNFDYSAQSWIRGKGREAVWEHVPMDQKQLGAQYLMDQVTAESSSKSKTGPKLGIVKVSSATNTRSMKCALIPSLPCGESVYTLQTNGNSVWQLLLLECFLTSFVFDYFLRLRFGGVNISAYLLMQCPIPNLAQISQKISKLMVRFAARLSFVSDIFGPFAIKLRAEVGPPFAEPPRSASTAIAPHERLRVRCILEAIVAHLYGLGLDDFKSILQDCDHPASSLSADAISGRLNPKGLWRVDKHQDPELRHTVLSIAAFRDLTDLISEHCGDDADGIMSFCSLHDGDGWQLPETLRLADLGLGHDDRAQKPQAVRSCLGQRFLVWQREHSVEESWAECEMHARNLLGDEEFSRLIRGTALPQEVEYEAASTMSLAAEASPGFPHESLRQKADSGHGGQGDLFAKSESAINKTRKQ